MFPSEKGLVIGYNITMECSSLIEDSNKLNTVEETSTLSPRERPTLDTKEVSQDKTCRPTLPWVSKSNSTTSCKGISPSSLPVVPQPGSLPNSRLGDMKQEKVSIILLLKLNKKYILFAAKYQKSGAEAVQRYKGRASFQVKGYT